MKFLRLGPVVEILHIYRKTLLKVLCHSYMYMGLKSLAKLFNFVVCNLCQSSHPRFFVVYYYLFGVFHLCKALFSGFLQF